MFCVLLLGCDIARQCVGFQRPPLDVHDRGVDESHAHWGGFAGIDHPEVVAYPRFACFDATEKVPEPLVVLFVKLEQQRIGHVLYVSGNAEFGGRVGGADDGPGSDVVFEHQQFGALGGGLILLLALGEFCLRIPGLGDIFDVVRAGRSAAPVNVRGSHAHPAPAAFVPVFRHPLVSVHKAMTAGSVEAADIFVAFAPFAAAAGGIGMFAREAVGVEYFMRLSVDDRHSEVGMVQDSGIRLRLEVRVEVIRQQNRIAAHRTDEGRSCVDPEKSLFPVKQPEDAVDIAVLRVPAGEGVQHQLTVGGKHHVERVRFRRLEKICLRNAKRGKDVLLEVKYLHRALVALDQVDDEISGQGRDQLFYLF